MIQSVIDIGTNTMLMLIAEYDGSIPNIKTIADMQRIPRLGEGVDQNRIISAESIDKAISILNEYKIFSKQHKSENIIVTATSFLRDARNKEEFIQAIKQATGLDIEILSGPDEAKLTFWGGTYDQLRITNEELRICLIDIGGGSTELSFSDNLPKELNPDSFSTSIVQYHSLDIGSVRLKEKFMISQPPSKESISMAEKYIIKELDKLNIDLNSAQLIGVAGTVTSLAAIKLGLPYFDKEKIEGLDITLDEIDSIFDVLRTHSIPELNKFGDYMEGRSDIIVTGVLILKTFMKKFGFRKIKVSTKGLRYGIFLRKALSI